MIDSKQIKRNWQWALGLISADEIEQDDIKRIGSELERQAEQAFTEQEELDAIERPASQVRVETDENGEEQ